MHNRMCSPTHVIHPHANQIELGKEGLDERDHYLLEVNLEDLELTTDKEQHDWLLPGRLYLQ